MCGINFYIFYSGCYNYTNFSFFTSKKSSLTLFVFYSISYFMQLLTAVLLRSEHTSTLYVQLTPLNWEDHFGPRAFDPVCQKDTKLYLKKIGQVFWSTKKLNLKQIMK